jgi:predicted small lipoprotein YifL
VKRAAAIAALLVVAAGCGGGGPLERVSTTPPDGAEPAGKRAERQGSNDPDAGERIFSLRPREGARLRYTVTVRNTSSKPVAVTGVAADPDRDGAFVPQAVMGAPVRIAPGASAPVAVEGMVHGCRYGGQRVALAGPELRYESGDTQQLDLGIQVELVVQGCT